MSVGERRARCYRKRGRPLLARGNGAAGPGLLSPHLRRPRPSGARSRPRRLVRRGGRHGLADHDRGREPLMATREHDNDQPASPWSRTSVQLSALFVLMLLVVGIAIAIFHHGSQHAQAERARHSSRPAHSRPPRQRPRLPRTWPVLACRRRPTGALRRAIPPAGVTWQRRRLDERAAIVRSGPAARPGRDQRLFCAQPERCASGGDEPDWARGYDEHDLTSGRVVRQAARTTFRSASERRHRRAKTVRRAVQIAGYKYDSYTPTRRR